MQHSPEIGIDDGMKVVGWILGTVAFIIAVILGHFSPFVGIPISSLLLSFFLTRCNSNAADLFIGCVAMIFAATIGVVIGDRNELNIARYEAMIGLWTGCWLIGYLIGAMTRKEDASR